MNASLVLGVYFNVLPLLQCPHPPDVDSKFSGQRKTPGSALLPLLHCMHCHWPAISPSFHRPEPKSQSPEVASKDLSKKVVDDLAKSTS